MKVYHNIFCNPVDAEQFPPEEMPVPTLVGLQATYVNLLARNLYFELKETAEAYRLSDEFRRSMESGKYSAHLDYRLYAVLDGPPGGLIGVADSYGFGDEHYLTLCVSPKFRRSGVGESLLRTALSICDLNYVLARDNEPSLRLARKVAESLETEIPVESFTNDNGEPCFRFCFKRTCD